MGAPVRTEALVDSAYVTVVAGILVSLAIAVVVETIAEFVGCTCGTGIAGAVGALGGKALRHGRGAHGLGQHALVATQAR